MLSRMRSASSTWSLILAVNADRHVAVVAVEEHLDPAGHFGKPGRQLPRGLAALEGGDAVFQQGALGLDLIHVSALETGDPDVHRVPPEGSGEVSGYARMFPVRRRPYRPLLAEARLGREGLVGRRLVKGRRRRRRLPRRLHSAGRAARGAAWSPARYSWFLRAMAESSSCSAWWRGYFHSTRRRPRAQRPGRSRSPSSSLA